MRSAHYVLVLVAIFLIVSVGQSQAYNPRQMSHQADRIHQYGRLAAKAIDPGPSPESKGNSLLSLGAYTSDGNSPGYILTHTWRDDQNHANPGHFVGWRTTPQIHFVFDNQACAGNDNPNTCARWIHYNMFNPAVAPGGVFINGANGLPIQTSPFAEGGLYPNMDVDELGHVIAVGEGVTSPDGPDYLRWVKMWWDLPPVGLWGFFAQDSIPDQPPALGDYNYHYPVTGYQEYGGQYVAHVLSINGLNTGNKDIITYWRKVISAATNTGTWTSMTLSDSVWTNSYSLATAQDASGKVAIVWCGYYQQSGSVPIFVKQSSDAGATWSPEFNIVPADDDWQPWLEVSSMIDSDGYTHAIWNAGGVDPCRIFHWTDRVGGIGVGTTSLIEAFDFNGLQNMCGRFGYNLFTVGKEMLAECNGRLYATWIQAGEPDKGDSTDCADPVAAGGVLGTYNGDIYMSISSSLNGLLWDARRNLTNSKSPGCDGTDGNPCDHDNYPSPSRLAMNTSPSVVGNTYWSTVPEAFAVRDALDPAYPDTGYFIDYQYIDDLFPGIARYNDDIIWTNNPIKWFRLPCVEPIIEPRIFMPDDFQHPEHWVKGGQEYAYDAEILNLGNAALTINNITAHVTEGAGWLTINTTNLVIPAAETGIASITLNPGGAIDPGPGNAYGIEAWIVIDSDDPNHPLDSFQIRTVIADTVIAISHEVIRTGEGVPIGALNNGNAANFPNGGGYMQFYEAGGIDEDCDSQNVYLYELSPMIMYDASTYYWNGYYDFTDPDPVHDLVPVPSARSSEVCSSGGMQQYITGEFVTADSGLGMLKVWGAPDDNVSFVIEKWEIFSHDGGTHTGVQIGEWTDLDVPGDTSVNDFGVVDQAGDYLYAYGQESDPTGCTPSDGRFYMTGLLGYYFTSELAGDSAVNHTGIDGAYVVVTEDLMTPNNVFIPDSVDAFFQKDAFEANNSEWADKRSFMDVGTFDIGPTDTLVVWIVHGSLIGATEPDVATQNADAKVWYAANRDAFGVCGCCGVYTGGYPGNTNCDIDGKRNLADITKLIDHVYISKEDLCCNENGNVDGDALGKRNLADITKLIDLVYISKNEVPPCL